MAILTTIVVAFALCYFSLAHAALPPMSSQNSLTYAAERPVSRDHAPHHARETCHNKCRFRFCNYQTVFKIGQRSGVAFTGAICSNVGKRIGIVKSAGEAYVFDGNSIIKISKWHPRTLKAPFSATFFKSYIVDHDNVSGIGHEEAQKNQLWFLKNRCVVIPVTSYQVLHRYGYVVGEKQPTGEPLRDCVEFVTESTSIFEPFATPKQIVPRQTASKRSRKHPTSGHRRNKSFGTANGPEDNIPHEF